MNPTQTQFPMIHRILAAFSALIFALTWMPNALLAQASSDPVNVTPKKCCDCLEFSVQNFTGAAGQNSGTSQSSTLGDIKIKVTVKHTGLAGCSSTFSGRVQARLVGGNEIADEKNFSVTSSTPANLELTIKAEKQRIGTKWEVVLYCDDGTKEGSDTYCKQLPISSGNCGSCSSCDKSASTEPINKSFELIIPTTNSFGGMASGSLRYYNPNFSYLGRSALFADVSSDMTVVKDAGGITQIQTGASTIDVADVVGEQAFTITHKDPSGAVFRTSKISFVNEGGANRLRFDTTFEGHTRRHEQTQPQAGTLVMERGLFDSVEDEFQVLIRDTLIKNTSTPGIEIRRREIQERPRFESSPGVLEPFTLSSVVEETWEKQVFSWVKTKEVIDPDDEALTSTWVYYQPGDTTGPGASTEGLGRLKEHLSYDGYRSFHTYGLNYNSVTTPYANDASGKVTTDTYNPGSKTRTVTTTVGGQVLSKTVSTHTDTTMKQRVYTNSGSYLETTITFIPSGQDFGGMPLKIVHPNNTITTFAYTRQAGGGYKTEMARGADSGGSVGLGMLTTTVTNSRGTTILTKTESIGYPSDGEIFENMAVTAVDNVGRPEITAYHAETVSAVGEQATASNPKWTTSIAYNCCGIESETDKYGIITYYAYDQLQRRIKTNRMGVTMETVNKGLTVETHRYAQTVSGTLASDFAGTEVTLMSRSVSNLGGTLRESWSSDPTSNTAGALVKASKSEITYQPSSGLSSSTVNTTPDNFAQTTESFLDGRTSKTTGALSSAMQYTYAVNTTGEVTSQSYLDGTNLRETTTTQNDWAGRSLRTDYMDGAFSTMTYNALGQMERSTEPGTVAYPGVITLMEYDSEGEKTITALDLDRDGVIDYGSDTVTFSDTDPGLDSGNPVYITTNKVWYTDATSQLQEVVASTSKSSPDGLFTSSQSFGVNQASTTTTNLLGNGSWTTTDISPDGTKQIQNYNAGLLTTASWNNTTGGAIASASYGYDNLNRQTTTTDSRTGQSARTYLSYTADIVKSVSDAGGRITAFTYDVRGRQISVNAPDTVDANNQTLTNITTTIYNSDNTVAETNGDQTYRVSHTYDFADRQISMTTYGTTTATTTWQYSPTRGFLLAKRDAANKGATYTYTAAGRLATRTWARGVSTTYSYDNVGRMVATNYSDTTPAITMAYDALGRHISHSNGIATSAFAYNASNLQIDTETITYTLPGKPAFTRVIDRSQDILNRDSGWQLKVGPTIENSVEYNYYANDGRLETVRRGNILIPQKFDYTYTSNSLLIAAITSPVHTVSNVYETTRDTLDSKVNKKLDTTTVSSYMYTVNNYGQRTGVTTGGTAFSGTPSWAWLYNSKGEVVKADHSAVTAFNRAYQYDGIGNRVTGGDLGSPISYTSNALNQYSAIGSLNPVHDDDGNMTSGPLPTNVNANSTLVWDAENRLIEAQVNSGSTVIFAYDSQSRRISETVGSNTTVYIYDGWNAIAEYSTSFALTKTYTWGLDLSGSFQGAGGVGGLLSVTDGTETYFPTFDGNGNVSEYLDSNGNTVAHYEYDPFGKTTISDGSKSNDFAHRFSTKPLDGTTGLYYYGYRFYDPETGRWPSRDPIQEQGGVNLYSMVWNDSIQYWDYLGMSGDNAPTCPPAGHTLVDEATSKGLVGNAGGGGGFVDRETGVPWVNPFQKITDGRTEERSGLSGYYARCRVVEAAVKERSGEDMENGRDVWSGSPSGVAGQAANALSLQKHGIIQDLVDDGLVALGFDMAKTAYVDVDGDYDLKVTWKACPDEGCPKPKCMRAYILAELKMYKMSLRAYGADKKPLNPQPAFKKEVTIKKAYTFGCLP